MAGPAAGGRTRGEAGRPLLEVLLVLVLLVVVVLVVRRRPPLAKPLTRSPVCRWHYERL